MRAGTSIPNLYETGSSQTVADIFFNAAGGVMEPSGFPVLFNIIILADYGCSGD
jgi:hypothetical protein